MFASQYLKGKARPSPAGTMEYQAVIVESVAIIIGYDALESISESVEVSVA